RIEEVVFVHDPPRPVAVVLDVAAEAPTTVEGARVWPVQGPHRRRQSVVRDVHDQVVMARHQHEAHAPETGSPADGGEETEEFEPVNVIPVEVRDSPDAVRVDVEDPFAGVPRRTCHSPKMARGRLRDRQDFVAPSYPYVAPVS